MAFQKVATEAVLDGCYRKENAWNIISNYSRYPEFMDNVDKVEIMERNGAEGISRWFTTVEEAPLTWVERDLFNTQSYEIIFKSIEGDFENINGHWSIKDRIDSGISINFEIQYNLGIPVIEEVLGHILQEKMKANIDKMMAAVKKELCSNTADERRHQRHAIGKSQSCLMNDGAIRLFLLNISEGGMATHYVPGLSGGGILSIADAVIEVDAVYEHQARNRCHFVFNKPLGSERLNSVLSGLEVRRDRYLPSPSEPQEARVFEDSKAPLRVKAQE